MNQFYHRIITPTDDQRTTVDFPRLKPNAEAGLLKFAWKIRWIVLSSIVRLNEIEAFQILSIRAVCSCPCRYDCRPTI